MWLLAGLVLMVLLLFAGAKVAQAAPPANDDFANAIVVGALPYSNSQTTVDATLEFDEQQPCGVGSTVWYSFTPTTSGIFEVDTLGSNFDTIVAVYTGNAVNALTLVGCDDDGGSLGGASKLSFFASAGSTYHIQAGGFVGHQGNLVLNVDQTEALDTTYWQCFNVTGGDDPRERLTLLTDNFGVDDATVRRAIRFCEGATKNGDGSLEPLEFYLCYTLTGGMDPREYVTLLTENFGEDEVRVRASTTMCEPAQKYADGSWTGELELPTYQCFNLTDGNDPNERVPLVTDNFGEDDVVVRRSNLMCEAALVNPDNGELPTEVRQCFTLTGGHDPRREVEVRTDRFGEDSLQVRASTLMCEAALKGDFFT
jgi:hypothetical protein